jgi:hypothetical protein
MSRRVPRWAVPNRGVRLSGLDGPRRRDKGNPAHDGFPYRPTRGRPTGNPRCLSLPGPFAPAGRPLCVRQRSGLRRQHRLLTFGDRARHPSPVEPARERSNRGRRRRRTCPCLDPRAGPALRGRTGSVPDRDRPAGRRGAPGGDLGREDRHLHQRRPHGAPLRQGRPAARRGQAEPGHLPRLRRTDGLPRQGRRAADHLARTRVGVRGVEAVQRGPCDYAGLSYGKLRGGSGILWPCNEQAPDGTERLCLLAGSAPPLGACPPSGAQRHFYVRSPSAPPAPGTSAPARRAAPASASRAARCAASALRPVGVRATQVRGRLPK